MDGHGVGGFSSRNLLTDQAPRITEELFSYYPNRETFRRVWGDQAAMSQRVEAHRRRGHITRAKLFGERNISNEPPLIYLVAPTLKVHPAFNTLAHSIAREIEIYRFDINEDWRAGVRVMRRFVTYTI